MIVAIIDDSEFFCAQQSRILKRQGIQVLEFSSLNEFLETMEASKWQLNIDLFLVDRFFDIENLDSVIEKIGHIIKEKTQARTVLWSCCHADRNLCATAGFDLFCFKGDDILALL